MKRAWSVGFAALVFIALSTFHFPQQAFAACEGCDVPGDCLDANCKGCDGSFCVDCCEINLGENPQALCDETPGCSFVNGECRNYANHDCSVSEVPSKSRLWILLGFMALGGAMAGFFKWKKYRKPVV